VKSAAWCFGASQKEVSLNWNKWLRQIHRWLSIAFTLAVIVNIAALIGVEQAVWVGLLALLPLVLAPAHRPVLVRAATCREVA
jgi:hypothetical protein